MKMNDDQVLAMLTEYQSEFHRTTGNHTQVTRKGAWLHLSYSGSKCRLSDIPKYLATLKSRPNWTSPKSTAPKTAITLQMPADAAARLLAKYNEDPEGFREHFKEFGIVEVKPT